MRHALRTTILLGCFIVWPSRPDRLFWQQPERPVLDALVDPVFAVPPDETSSQDPAAYELIKDDLVGGWVTQDLLIDGAAARSLWRSSSIVWLSLYEASAYDVKSVAGLTLFMQRSGYAGQSPVGTSATRARPPAPVVAGN